MADFVLSQRDLDVGFLVVPLPHGGSANVHVDLPNRSPVVVNLALPPGWSMNRTQFQVLDRDTLRLSAPYQFPMLTPNTG